MKNIKKFIDFEITLFLTILFLFGAIFITFNIYSINDVNFTDSISLNNKNFIVFLDSYGLMIDVENLDKDTTISLIDIPSNDIFTSIFSENNFSKNISLNGRTFIVSYNDASLKINLETLNKSTFINLIDISYKDIFICIVIFYFICINIIYFIYKIFSFIFFIASYIKRFLSNKVASDSSIEYIDLNTYDLVIANTLYYNSIDLYRLFNIFEKFLKKENYLYEDNTINISKSIGLPTFEQSLLDIYSTKLVTDTIHINTFIQSNSLNKNISKINADLAKEEKLYTIEKQIINKLKQDNFIKFTTIKQSFGTSNKKYIQFLESLHLEKFLTSSNVEFLYMTSPSIILAFILFIIFSIICIKINQYLLFLLIPIIFICVFNCNRIFLTNKGKLEKLKIKKYKSILEQTSDLTEREKLFLELFK